MLCIHLIAERAHCFVCTNMLQPGTEVSEQCWSVRVRRSECYMIKEEVRDLPGALPPLIAVLRML